MFVLYFLKLALAHLLVSYSVGPYLSTGLTEAASSRAWLRPSPRG